MLEAMGYLVVVERTRRIYAKQTRDCNETSVSVEIKMILLFCPLVSTTELSDDQHFYIKRRTLVKRCCFEKWKDRRPVGSGMATANRRFEGWNTSSNHLALPTSPTVGSASATTFVDE